jgi:hypothetical protein
MIKILDIWVKSQTFSGTSLESVQTIINDTAKNAVAADTALEKGLEPKPESTTPVGSPVQAKQDVKNETVNVAANTTGTGEYQSWVCFSYVCGVGFCLRISGRYRSWLHGRTDHLTRHGCHRALSAFAPISIGPRFSQGKCVESPPARSVRKPDRFMQANRTIRYRGKGIVYSVATMLQIYIPKAVAIFLQLARAFILS